jgi:hypothetical protein
LEYEDGVNRQPERVTINLLDFVVFFSVLLYRRNNNSINSTTILEGYLFMKKVLMVLLATAITLSSTIAYADTTTNVSLANSSKFQFHSKLDFCERHTDQDFAR